MLRRLLPALFAVAVAFSCVGCEVSVSEPVSDIDKAEPDKELLGTWSHGEDGKGRVVIDVPEVKGNPKGIMRYTEGKDSYYFFVSAVGKERYANLCLIRGRDYHSPAQFGTE